MEKTKTQKKFLTILFSFALLIVASFAFVGCGNGEPEEIRLNEKTSQEVYQEVDDYLNKIYKEMRLDYRLMDYTAEQKAVVEKALSKYALLLNRMTYFKRLEGGGPFFSSILDFGNSTIKIAVVLTRGIVTQIIYWEGNDIGTDQESHFAFNVEPNGTISYKSLGIDNDNDYIITYDEVNGNISESIVIVEPFYNEGTFTGANKYKYYNGDIIWKDA